VTVTESRSEFSVAAGSGFPKADFAAFEFFRRRTNLPQRMVGAEEALAADLWRE
jgi:hypothetical protein